MMILLMLLSLSIYLFQVSSLERMYINQVGEASGRQYHSPHRLSLNQLLENREFLYEKHQQYHHQLLDDDE